MFDPHRRLQLVHRAKRLLAHFPLPVKHLAKQLYHKLLRWEAQFYSFRHCLFKHSGDAVNTLGSVYSGGTPWGDSAGPSDTPMIPQPTVIIAAYNARELVWRCLESVLAHTSAPARILVIDDASTDDGMGPMLEGFRSRGVELHRNETNLGYTATVNLGIRMAERNDVVLLNSDTVVPPRWLDNLRLAAYSTPDVATATPLSDNAGAFSAPQIGSNILPKGVVHADFARLVSRSFSGSYPEAPTGNGFCLYIRRAMLDDIGLFNEARFPRGYGEENDLCLRALDRGWRHVVDTRTYVSHHRSASFGNEKTTLMEQGRKEVLFRFPEYPRLVEEFLNSPSMSQARMVVEQVVNKAMNQPRPLPRILYVISTRTGGTPQTNQDLMHGVADDFESFLLVCDSASMTLFRYEDDRLVQIEYANLRKPVRFASHRSGEYDKLILHWLVRHDIELVHIRHISWHSLGLPRVATELNIPVIFSFHDFYTLCPNINLVDGTGAYCRGNCRAAEETPCANHLWARELPPPLTRAFVERWRSRMNDMLRFCDAYVTTTRSTRDLIVDVLDLNPEKLFTVIPHGRNFQSFLPPAGSTENADPPYRLLLPGNIGVHKGATLLARIHELDRDGLFELHILGTADSELSGIGVQHGPYRREEFQRKVAAIAPHLGLVFSIWPETYCHILTEMWACGIPVVGIDFGAVGERIRRHGGGWLVDCCNPELILERLRAILGDQDDYRQKCEAVAAWQEGYGRANTIELMASAYLELYGKIRHHQLAIDYQG